MKPVTNFGRVVLGRRALRQPHLSQDFLEAAVVVQGVEAGVDLEPDEGAFVAVLGALTTKVLAIVERRVIRWRET